MNDEIYDLLESDDPQDRRQAVKLLAKQGDNEALQTLAEAYKYEDDPELKELIKKAAVYIRKQNQAPKWEASKEVEDPNAPPPDAEYVEVSAMARKSAAALVDQSIDLSVQGREREALKSLQKALAKDPNLRYDARLKGLVSEIAGVPEDDAIAFLESTDERKQKRKSKETVEGQATWGDALTDLAIYGIVTAGVLIVGLLLVIQVIDAAFAAAVSNLQSMDTAAQLEFQFETGLSVDELRVIYDGFRAGFLGASVVVSIIYGVVAGIFQVIFMLIYLFFFHIAATSILGGEGTFPNLIHKVTLFITGLTVVSSLLAFGYAFISAQGISAALADVSADPDLVVAQFESLFTSLNTISLLSTLIGLISLFWLGYLIGQAYDFGMVKGCLTQIVAYILLAVAMCACSFAASSLFGSVLSSAFEAAAATPAF